MTAYHTSSFIHKAFCILLIFVGQLAWSQVTQEISRDQLTNELVGQRQNADDNEDNLDVTGERPPITDYLIIVARDTTNVDTTLHMHKDYKYNYLRKDDFELMPFHNVGQVYNSLAKQHQLGALMPTIGAKARHLGYLESKDVTYYRVPTPLSDLYFKTVINQGQQLDALFTTNVSPQLNLAIGYKGVRSAGNYENTLTSTNNLRIAANYHNKRYRLKAHTTFQNIQNQENGGLQAASIAGFIADDPDLRDRARLEPNIDDGRSILDGRRFYMNQDYLLLGAADSLSNQLRVYNTNFYEDKRYRYRESNATTSFYGEAFDTAIRDQTDHEQGAIELGAIYKNNYLGELQAGLSRQVYNYGYNRVLVGTANTITDRLKGEAYLFKAFYAKNYRGFDLEGKSEIILTGDLTGQFIDGTAGYQWGAHQIKAGIHIASEAPQFNQQLFQSDYRHYNWQNTFNNTERQELRLGLISPQWIDASLSLSSIQDLIYFEQQDVLDTNGDVSGYVASPVQTNASMTYLKVKLRKEHRLFGRFGMEHQIMYQQVDQPERIINVPDFTTRNTLYYKNRFFKKALLLQTGVTVKYFTDYHMDAYDPIVGEFMVQNEETFGNFPMIDIFLNAKIRQTRIFFKAEQVNSFFLDTNYFSAPRHPYRDFSFRFGVVWNFFL